MTGSDLWFWNMANLGTAPVVGVWRGRELGGRVNDEFFFHPDLFPLKNMYISLYKAINCQLSNVCHNQNQQTINWTVEFSSCDQVSKYNLSYV